MKPVRDPEMAELNHVLAVCPLNGRTILEIGCGDGTFTRQYAHMARRVVAIDPAQEDLVRAQKKNRLKNTDFIQAEGETLPFPSQSFEIALLASSL